MARKSVGARYSVSNLTRGLDVMELLASHPAGLGVTEVASALHIPKNAAFRITAALCERGYLRRNNGTKSFALSPRLMTMGYQAANQESIIEKAMPFMRALRDAVKETVVLCALTEAGGIILDQAAGSHPFRFVVDPGAPFRLHTSAQGKALLAHLPEEERECILSRLTLTRFTERTITTRKALRAELDEVRRAGYALDRAEELDGVYCAAAAILDARRYPVAAVCVTGPASRLTEALLDAVGRQARECAQRISQTLGFVAGNGRHA